MSSSVSQFLDLKLTSSMDVPALDEIKILKSDACPLLPTFAITTPTTPWIEFVLAFSVEKMHPLSAWKKGQHKEIWVPVASNMAVGNMSHDVTIIHQSSTPPMTSEASSFCRHGKGAVEDMTSLDNFHSGGLQVMPPQESRFGHDLNKKSRI